jgi:hypothetical protein
VQTQPAAVQASAARTFTRWSAAYAADKLQLTAPGATDYAASYNGSITALHDWLLARLKWMDAQLLTGAGANSTVPGAGQSSSAGAADVSPAAAGGGAGNASKSPTPLAASG